MVVGRRRALCALCLIVGFLVTSSHASQRTPDTDYLSPGRTTSEEDRIAGREFFVHKIFSKYGDGGEMSFDGFEHLLERLGLGNVIIQDHDLDSHRNNDTFRDTHRTHEHGLTARQSFEVVELPAPHRRDNHSKQTHKPNRTSGTTLLVPADHDHGRRDERCLSATEMLYAFDIAPPSPLSENSFLLLCPAIVYELVQGHCGHSRDHADDSMNSHQWAYASLAVLLISLCGLLSVAVIPLMQKWFYHTMLQFLVGLAIGSLSGDALLHLLPHAMVEHDDGHQHGALPRETDEQLMVWRGMAALGGIFFFFVAERLLEAFTASRRRKKEVKALAGSENEQMELDSKLSHYRKNSYGLRIGADGKEVLQMLPQEAPQSRKSSVHSVHEVGFHGRSSFSLEPDSAAVTVTVSEHHGHGHGHSHEVPQSASAVALMVIMGDGLHNFCDGLAIGAAFAANTAGGLSTTVAVFCHELPHELGDFAMLLKTGMRVKQALLYNGLSSVLCFLGMVIGLSLGKVDSATSWVFAATAGMFLYIALVDMLPELSATSGDPNAPYTLAVQVLGIAIGVCVMLTIGLFEPQLLRLFS